MAFRTPFPLMKIASTNVVQPALGSWVTAVSPATGFVQPSGAPLTLTLGTAAASGNDASQMFVAGQDAWLIDPNGSHFEVVKVGAVLNNTVTLNPKPSTTLTNPNGYTVTEYPHVAGVIGTGTYIIPKQQSNNILIMFEDGGTGAFLYVGSGPLFTATFNRVYKIAKTAANGQPGYWNAGMYSPGNPMDLSEVFVLGTTGDTYFTSVAVD